MSEDPTPTQSPLKAKKSPFKTRYESLGYFFGQPLESFENLLPDQPSTSAIAPTKPTDLDIIRHWMYQEDQSRTTRSHNNVNTIGVVSDNLVAFYRKYHPSVELRYVKYNLPFYLFH